MPGSASGRVGIFVKEPRPGQVKTRLSPPLTAAEAAAFYRVAQEETISRLAAGPWEVTLVFAGDEGYFRDRFPQLPRLAQGEGDLGRRLQLAFSVLQQPGIPAIMVGSDSPDLPLSLVASAFTALADADVVVAPASDGGYVLIGGRRLLPQLFVDIPWSSAEVLACTRRRAVESGLVWRELPAWEDVDDFSSLLALLTRSPASASAAFVRTRLGHHLPGRSGRS
ncbi:TIGR04282 family arsenosugar biosynthesis glycosyltransferase [Desulfuromonas carbonis]